MAQESKSKLIVYGYHTIDESILTEETKEEQEMSLLIQQQHLPDFFNSMALEFRCQVASIACGHSHGLILAQEGLVFSFGSNQFGQRGLTVVMRNEREKNNGFNPTLIESLAKEVIVSVSAGLYHSAALTQNGIVYTWGRGFEGQLGQRSIDNLEEPTRVESIKDISTIVCGGSHTIFLSKKGFAFATGDNQWGQLGIDKNGTHVSVPTQVQLQGQIIQIAAGSEHSTFLLSDHQLYICGNNLFGQCGITGVQSFHKPQLLKIEAKISKLYSSLGTFGAVKTQTGQIFVWGTGSWGHARKPTDVMQICAFQNQASDKFKDIIVADNYALTINEKDQVHLLGTHKLPDIKSPNQKTECRILNIEISDKMSANNRFILVAKDVEQQVPQLKEKVIVREYLDFRYPREPREILEENKPRPLSQRDGQTIQSQYPQQNRVPNNQNDKDNQQREQFLNNVREVRDGREVRDVREIRDVREVRDARDAREYREGREYRDIREERNSHSSTNTHNNSQAQLPLYSQNPSQAQLQIREQIPPIPIRDMQQRESNLQREYLQQREIQQQRDLALQKELMATKEKDLQKDQLLTSSTAFPKHVPHQPIQQQQQQSNCAKCNDYADKITMLNTRLSNQEEMMANQHKDRTNYQEQIKKQNEVIEQQKKIIDDLRAQLMQQQQPTVQQQPQIIRTPQKQDYQRDYSFTGQKNQAKPQGGSLTHSYSQSTLKANHHEQPHNKENQSNAPISNQNQPQPGVSQLQKNNLQGSASYQKLSTENRQETKYEMRSITPIETRDLGVKERLYTQEAKQITPTESAMQYHSQRDSEGSDGQPVDVSLRQNLNKSRGLIQSIDTIITQFKSMHHTPVENKPKKSEVTQPEDEKTGNPNTLIKSYFQRIEQLQQNIARSKQELRKSLEASKFCGEVDENKQNVDMVPVSMNERGHSRHMSNVPKKQPYKTQLNLQIPESKSAEKSKEQRNIPSGQEPFSQKKNTYSNVLEGRNEKKNQMIRLEYRRNEELRPMY